MIRISLALLTILYSNILFAQIKNADLENRKSTEQTLPADWTIVPADGFTVSMDDKVKFDGTYSLRISSREGSSRYLSVTQTVPVQPKGLTRMALSVNIKTDSLKGAAVLWCQLRDKNGKPVGFETLANQQQVNGTADWKTYTLTLIVDPQVSNLVLGAYSQGAGTTWLDGFSLTEATGSNEPATAEVSKYSSEFNTIVKKNSIYSDSLDWRMIETNLKLLGNGLKTQADAKILNNYVLQQLRKAGDNHSFIQSRESAERYAAGNTAQDTVVAKLLPGRIGYISIPAYGSINKEAGEQFAQHIQDLIRTLDTQNQISGWIVDLRGNGGGNMYPMMAGLKPLIGNGPLGYFVKGKNKTEWQIGVKVANPYKLKDANGHIAVLIGPRTGSSGEMTAITFIGKNNSKLFGEPSAGYVTANSMHALSDGSKLLLASSYCADRTGKKYLDRIYPDVVAKTQKDSDIALTAATNWLTEK
jgi:carboxyl-terminal processing protease